MNHYQNEAARTLILEPDKWPSGQEMMLLWCALGLTGEAGEVAELIKKGVLHQHGIDRQKLREELGDVLWYLAGLATLLDIDFQDVANANLDKLHARYPHGWDAERSKNRGPDD